MSIFGGNAQRVAIYEPTTFRMGAHGSEDVMNWSELRISFTAVQDISRLGSTAIFLNIALL